MPCAFVSAYPDDPTGQNTFSIPPCVFTFMHVVDKFYYFIVRDLFILDLLHVHADNASRRFVLELCHPINIISIAAPFASTTQHQVKDNRRSHHDLCFQ